MPEREHISENLRKEVRRRAGDRCEYCGLSQIGQEATFHVDHIVPVSAGGQTKSRNLALACVFCSLSKGDRQRATDRLTKTEVPLFHPRRDSWRLHFRWKDVTMIGISPTGRATVEAMKMNRMRAHVVRKYEAVLGRHPPPEHL